MGGPSCQPRPERRAFRDTGPLDDQAPTRHRRPIHRSRPASGSSTSGSRSPATRRTRPDRGVCASRYRPRTMRLNSATVMPASLARARALPLVTGSGSGTTSMSSPRSRMTGLPGCRATESPDVRRTALIFSPRPVSYQPAVVRPRRITYTVTAHGPRPSQSRGGGPSGAAASRSAGISPVYPSERARAWATRQK